MILGTLQAEFYLTGTWRDLSEDGYHWGAFQLWWHPNARGMVGKFAGKGSDNHIDHGIWLWVRDSQKPDDKQRLYDLVNWAADKEKGGYLLDAAGVRQELRRLLRPRRQSAP